MTERNFKKNIIIGAGIAGLSMACSLKDQEEDFYIFEKSSSLGGNWQSHTYKESIYEFGPNTIIDKSQKLRDLIQKAGLEDELISHSLKDSKRYFHRKNRFIEVSSNPFKMIFSRLLGLKAKLRLLLEPFINSKSNETESVFDFFSRRLGADFSEHVLGPALQGVWGGDTRQLNMSQAMPFLYKLEKEHGSLLKGLLSSRKKKNKTPLQTISFKNGLQSLCSKLEAFLGNQNIKTNSEVITISKEEGLYKLQIRQGANQEYYYCKNLSIASEAFNSAKLLKESSPTLAKALDSIFHAPMFLISYSIKKEFFEDKKEYLEAFGFLNANKAHFTLGTIFASQVFTERNLADEYLFVSFLGGTRNAQIIDYEIQDLNSIALNEAKEIFDNALDLKIELENIHFVNSKLIEKAIPQYNDFYAEAKKVIDFELKKNPQLKLLGNYMNGVSIVDTVDYSDQMSKI